MQTILFKLGPVSVSLFGTFVALGIMVGFYILNKEAGRKRLNQDKIFNLAFYNIIVGIIGARLYYVFVFDPGYYLKHLSDIFMIHQGGLSIQGALIAAVLFSIVYIKLKELFFWEVADTFVPAIILGQAIGRIGCDVFGVSMDKNFFWGVKINNQLLHPVQIYEVLLNYILFILLWNYRDKIKYNGQLFLYYLIGFSLNRGIVEFFRINPIVIKPFTIAHVTSLVIICGALVTMVYINESNIDNFQSNRIEAKGKLIDNILLMGGMVLSIITYYGIY
ncbi:prolipoprotein diacylglyceryl transferase [Sporohalobacter salinus]|uniref:prolipoprotein diacylglyceryl transferase n=1 Tax=Sporohalobacter salinus TaxID=1494606 RepID=UPI001961D2DC|nr:prolipoprotein diacylglyceryl transferase [Sporohalobacter salinus]MBM7624702.1 phosphatidylglycerol:prolipoprotein diacylglycerol transferase [Sporohalobacter salinus]